MLSEITYFLLSDYMKCLGVPSFGQDLVIGACSAVPTTSPDSPAIVSLLPSRVENHEFTRL